MAAELEVLGGSLDNATVTDDEVRLPGADAGAVRRLFEEIGPTLPARVTEGIHSIEEARRSAVIRLGERADPQLAEIDGRWVSCHLHGQGLSEATA